MTEKYSKSFVNKYPYKIVWVKFKDGKPLIHNVRSYIGNERDTIEALKTLKATKSQKHLSDVYGSSWKKAIGLEGSLWADGDLDVRVLEKLVREYDIDDIFTEKGFKKSDLTGEQTVFFYNKLLFNVDTLVELRHDIAAIERLIPDSIFLFDDVKRKTSIEFTINEEAVSLNDFISHDNSVEPHIDGNVTDASVIRCFSTTELAEFGDTIYFTTVADLMGNIARYFATATEQAKRKVFYGAIRKFFPSILNIPTFEKVLQSLGRKDIEESASLLWAITLKKNELYNILFTEHFPSALSRVSINSIILRNEEVPTVDFVDTRALFEMFDCATSIPAISFRQNETLIVKQAQEDYKSHGARFAHARVLDQCIAFEHRMSTDKKSILYSQMQTITIYPNGRVETTFNVREEIGIKLEDVRRFMEVTNHFIEMLNKRADIFSMIGRRLRFLSTVEDQCIANINATVHFVPGQYAQFETYLNMFAPFIETAPEEFKKDYRDTFVLRKIMRYPTTRPSTNEFEDKNYRVFMVKFNNFMTKQHKIYIREIKSLSYLNELATLFDHIVQVYNNRDKIKDRTFFLRAQDITTEGDMEGEVNRLKKYQALDPDTYMYHESFPNAAPFSTKCQYIRQANLFTDEEFAKLDDPRKEHELKYKSATTGETLHFVCMHSEKYKYPGFLSPAGHPTGKCSICCGVEKQWKGTRKKKRLLFRQCMSMQEGEEQAGYSIMRYLGKYSDDVHLGRFTDLPRELESLFNNIPVDKYMEMYKMYGVFQEAPYSFVTAAVYAYNGIDISQFKTTQEAMEKSAEAIYTTIQTCITNIDVKSMFSRINWRANLSFDSVDELRQTLVDGKFTPDESVSIFKPMLEATLDIHIVIISITQTGIDLTNTLNAVQEFLTEDRDTIVIIRTEKGNFYPIYYVTVNRYSASHKNIKKISKSVFKRGDAIVNTLAAIWKANFNEEGVERIDREQIKEQYVSRNGVVSFVRRADGLIVPMRMRVDATIPHSVIKSHKTIENDYKKARAFLTLGGYHVIRDATAVLGVFLQDGGAFFLEPTPIATFEKDYDITKETFSPFKFDTCNGAIASQTKKDDERTLHVMKMLEGLELYNMMKLALVKSIRLERNRKMRMEIMRSHENLPYLEFVEDIRGKMSHQDRDAILANYPALEAFVEAHTFDFDHTSKNAIEQLLQTGRNERAGQERAIADIVRKHVDPHIKIVKQTKDLPPPTEIPNVTYFCGEIAESSRCDGKQLMLTKEEYITNMSRLIQELFSSEITRVFLLNGIFDRVVNRNVFTRQQDVLLYTFNDEGTLTFV